jgi:hypothetical protein
LIRGEYSADFDVIIDDDEEEVLTIEIDGSYELARRLDLIIVCCLRVE